MMMRSTPLRMFSVAAALALAAAGCAGADQAPHAAGADGPQSDDTTPTGAADGGSNDGFVSETPPDAAVPRALDDTWEGIHTFLIFLNEAPAATLQTSAGSFDFVWGNVDDEIAPLRAGNPTMMLSYYVPFSLDAGGCEYHDLNWWKANHPDWILYRCDEATPAYTWEVNGRYDCNAQGTYDAAPPEGHACEVPLDVTNPDVRAWELDHCFKPASDKGYDAIALDVFGNLAGGGACGVYQGGAWKQLFDADPNHPSQPKPNNTQYDVAELDWLKITSAALHALPHPLAIIPNDGGPDWWLNAAVDGPQYLDSMVALADGVLDETGFTGQGVFAIDYVTDEAWVRKVHYMQRVQAAGHAYYVTNNVTQAGMTGDPPTPEQMQWSVGSYLMGKGHAASVVVNPGGIYGGIAAYPEYAAKIGHPCGEAQPLASGAWVRDYSGGFVVVNPQCAPDHTTYQCTVTTTPMVTLPAGSFTDLYGRAVGATIAVPPASGRVLLSSGAPRC